jgi:hypothetical protein
MPEVPNSILLNRHEAMTAVATHFAPQIEMLTQMTNYASNLIPRTYSSSKKQVLDIMVCYGLLKQFATMLDAVDVLVRAGAIQAAFVPARAAFEASLYIEWMLISDGEKKALYYFVGNMRQERLWGLRAVKESAESNDLLREMRELGADIFAQQPSLGDEGTRHVKEVDANLRRQEFSDANAAFDEYAANARRPVEPKWYQVLGVKSIRAMARELQRLPDYMIYDGTGSQVAHASSYQGKFNFARRGANARPIRDITSINTVLTFAATNALLVFHCVLGFYRHDELPAFARQYATEWRKAFTGIPRVKAESD